MKRFISTILVGFILFSTITFLSGCGGGKPNDVSDQHYQYALKAIEIADGYLDFDLTVDEAYAEISELEERKEELPDGKVGDKTHAKDFSIESNVSMLSSALVRGYLDLDTDIYDDVLERRNSLAKAIGEKTR